MRLSYYIEEKALGVNKKFIRTAMAALQPAVSGKVLSSKQAGRKFNEEFVRYGVFFIQGDPSMESADLDLSDGGILSAVALKNGKIIVYYDPDTFWYVLMDKDNWFLVMAAVEKAIEHELVHRAQFFRMSTKALRTMKDQDPAQVKKYLADKQEQMAFARQAVTELSMLGYKKKDILALLRQPAKNKKPSKDMSFAFSMYSQFFTVADKEMKRFLKYAYWYANGDVKSIEQEEKERDK